MEQVDIVPTTALALGLPIPFSNLGALIPEVLLPYKTSHSERSGENVADGYSGRVSLDFLTALEANVQQLHTYLMTYAQYSDDFPAGNFLSLEQNFRSVVDHHQELLHLVQENGGDALPFQQELTQVASEYLAYMKEVKRMCSKVWAKFDDYAIAQGLLMLTLTVFISTTMLLDVKNAAVSLHASISSGLKVGVICAVFLLLLTGIDPSILGLLAALLNTSFLCLISTLVIFIWKFRSVIIQGALTCHMKLWLHHSGMLNEVKLLTAVVMVAYAAAMFSNSFVLYEADMLAYFIQSLVFCLAVQTVKTEALQSRGKLKVPVMTVLSSVFPHLTLMVCVRLSKLFYACRDLQLQDGCESTTFLQGQASAAASLGSLTKWRLAVSCFSAAAVPIVLIVQLRRSGIGAYLDGRLRWLCELGLPLCVVGVAVHWCLQSLPQPARASLSHWQHVSAPLAVYFIVVVIVIVALLHPFKAAAYSPPSPSCEAPTEDGEGATMMGSLLPSTMMGSLLPSTKILDERALRQRRAVLEEEMGNSDVHLIQDKGRGDDELPGRGTSLSAAVIAVLLVSLWVPLAMLLNDGVALSVFLTAAEITCALLISRQHGHGIVLV